LNNELLKFGFDLDNTLIDYKKSVEQYCQDHQISIANPNIKKLKAMLKDTDSSSSRWQSAQKWLYGEGLHYASLREGSEELFEFLVSKNFAMYIVSHKSSVNLQKYDDRSLQGFSLQWIQKSKLAKHFGLEKNIYFEETRDLKIKRINQLNLTYFVDDLEEVLLHPIFDSKVKKILLSDTSRKYSEITVARNMTQIKVLLQSGN